MIFPSFTLLSGIALFSSTTAWPTPPIPVTHYVDVSNDTAGLVFDPPYITAAPGDTVSFIFHPKNHTVTQSIFDAPCTPLFGGIDTGFVTVAPGTYYNNLPARKFLVEDSNPVWIHCRQAANTAASHCGQGMVFAVNPGPDGSDSSFATFKAKALTIGAQLVSKDTKH